jgi:predicted HicB family RNase H-like nuclease
MTVKRKAIKSVKSNEQSVDDIINRGGKTTVETEAVVDDEIRFTLRIPRTLIQSIDKNRKERVGNVSRNQWILEAISEYLE